ncbi:hypothetical protein COCOBI_17-0510 [Coccomyxa sp. Obi]|nr:hypothetical protein COCOBI_17-0510 [Coccomyxa sp. Obi]
MRYVLLLMLAVCISSSYSQTAPAITGPATGTCGPIPIRYGTSGSPDAKLQTFVAPAPLFISNCFPAASDTYVYTLGVGQQSNYILPGPAALHVSFSQQGSSSPPRDLPANHGGSAVETSVRSTGPPLVLPSVLNAYIYQLYIESADWMDRRLQIAIGQQDLSTEPLSLRSIGSDVSPAFGYRGTPSLDLTMATPNFGVSPLPVPAGFLDVTLIYSANRANYQCANASNTQTSAFLIQAPTATTVTGPLTSTVADPSFHLYVNVTYPAAAIQLPFSDPAAVQTGAVTVTDASGTPLNGSTSVASSGPGFVTYAFTPSPPLPVGVYNVSATYAPSATYVLGSSSTSPFTFVITPPPTTTVPPTTITPSTTPAATTQTPAPTTKTPTPSTKPPVKTPTPTPTINPAVKAAQAKLDADLAKLPHTSGLARIVLLIQIARDYVALAAAERGASG